MENAREPLRRKGGRRLSFDRDVALREAMLLFWRHGYEGTSLNALTAALGVTPPSIYTAFGDKKRLFLEAVELYLSGEPRAEQIIDEAATAQVAARGLLTAAAAGFTGEHTPSGCLLATSAISCSAESAEIQASLAAIRRAVEQRLCRRIRRDIDEGVLVPDADDTALAGMVMATIQGLSTLARDGAARAHLLAIVEAVMAAWPAEGTDADPRLPPS